MRFTEHKLLVTVLGIFALITAVAACYTGNTFQTRRETEARAAFAEQSRQTFGGYTLEQYVKSYSSYKDAVYYPDTDTYMISAPLINQYPLLPCGCEIAAAVSLISYNGYSVSLEDFTERFITYDENFYHDEDEVLHGPDPAEVFVGNPYGWGYGCYPNVLAKSMNDCFAALGSTETAHAVTGLSEDDLEELIKGGVPVIVWATLDMKEYNYTDPSVWIVGESGRELTWYKGSHTLLLTGLDEDYFYFCDPNDKETRTRHSRKIFMNRYEAAGMRAVIVKR
ncbi:MAG: C39 family peptidase [Ruminococcus sp.]|nr:C39 family peptidase [Ruminococcus sp.]